MMTPLLASFALPETFFVGLVGSFAFGLIGLVMLMLGFKMFEWITPSWKLKTNSRRATWRWL
jgi:uncharacterized membrane protein YjfL (UPF0719 family)